LRGARLACVKPAASVRSEPGSNSHVENSIIGIYVTSLNRRELHTHPGSINHPERQPITARVPWVQRTRERHPRHQNDVTSLDKRDRQSLFQRSDISIRSRQAPPPTFLFLLYMQLSKNRPKSQNLSQKLTNKTTAFQQLPTIPSNSFSRNPRTKQFVASSAAALVSDRAYRPYPQK
jgi:hypothetical protein